MGKKGKRKTSIMGTLLKAFFVPIVLIIILGVVSYKTASATIKSKVEEASKSTISAMGMYCEMLTDNVASKALEMVVGENLSSYYEVYGGKKDTKAAKYLSNAEKDLLQMQSSVQYIYSYHVIPEKGEYITSVFGETEGNIYDGFINSEEGNYFSGDEKQKNAWLGYHAYLDGQLGIDQEKYGIVYYQKFLKADAYLVMDITMKKIEEMLDGMEFGENSVKALVTRDGREIVRIQAGDEGKTPVLEHAVFTDKEFYAQSQASEEAGGRYVEYEGETYLYVYAPVGDTGIMLCGLIPQSNIVKDVRSIRNLSVLMIIVGCITAFVTGGRIASGMSKAVKGITKELDEIAEGNLKREIYLKRKDEFSLLADGLNDMLSSMRTIIADMQKFGNKVKDMAEGVAMKSETIDTSVREISQAVDEVAAGTQKQAQEADGSNDRMSAFAEKVEQVSCGAGDMSNTIDRATAAVEQGQEIVGELNKKSETTVVITKTLVESISGVEERSAEIVSFIDTINNIATQTNLLSLNASIEAARAGENGRGFAVVAEEIRKLADESMEAGKSIREIVGNIVDTTQKTADSAREAEAIVYEQADFLRETIQVFGEINNCVEELVKGLKDIVESIQEINGEKDQVQDSIHNISIVAEQSAVAAEEVTATLDEQVRIISGLAKDVEDLKKEADALDESISKFIV